MDLDHVKLSRLLETAIVSARLSGQRAMEEINYIKVSIKNENEQVTQADIRCQEIIIERIKEAYPDAGFIAEETEDGKLFKEPPRGKEQLWWVIDPIDGTNNFAKKIYCFTVSIAVMYQGEPIVGVVFDPSADLMFTVVKGGEPQLNGRKITVSKKAISRFSSIALDSLFEQKLPEWAQEIIKRTKYRNLGTAALHLSYVAGGGFIAAILNMGKLWDIAAGSLLVQSAGGKVTDFSGEKIFPVDLSRYNGEGFEVLASNRKAQSEILGLLKSH